MTPLPPDLQDIDNRLNTDLVYFMAEAPMMVLDKQGHLVVFRLNKAQKYLHDKLEEQKKRTGKVRALILKGRQEGCSLYVTGRNYHITTRRPGVSTLLISHEGKATQHLFSMFDRYQNHMDTRLKPTEGAANRTQQTFPALDSQITVGTAGNEDVGRSGTNQIFHWSEAAYTDNAEAIQDGAMQTVPDLPGTEIILESTANGPTGLFYSMCQDALHGRGEYQLIFIPWWWMDEYEADSSNHPPLDDEEAYGAENLREYPSLRQVRKLNWRRNKVHEFSAGGGVEKGLRKFKQIYPANPIEAFQASGKGLFTAGAITAARKNITLTDEQAPVVLGVDTAGNGAGSDRSLIVVRQGRHVRAIIKIPKQPNMDMAVAGAVIREIQAWGASMAFIDIGYGHGTLDRLNELKWGRYVMGVGFGEGATRNDVYLNKRSEMIIDAADWINGGGVRIVDDDEFHADLAIIPVDSNTSNGLRYIVAKNDIKKVYNGKSTDILDAFALTFAYPVRRAALPGAGGGGGGGGEESGWKKKTVGGPLSSVNRRRGQRGGTGRDGRGR